MKRSHYSNTAYGRMRDRITEREKQKREGRKRVALTSIQQEESNNVKKRIYTYTCKSKQNR